MFLPFYASSCDRTDYTMLGKRVVPRLRELAPTDIGSQEEGFTQPRDHSLAEPCISQRTSHFDGLWRDIVPLDTSNPLLPTPRSSEKSKSRSHVNVKDSFCQDYLELSVYEGDDGIPHVYHLCVGLPVSPKDSLL